MWHARIETRTEIREPSLRASWLEYNEMFDELESLARHFTPDPGRIPVSRVNSLTGVKEYMIPKLCDVADDAAVQDAVTTMYVEKWTRLVDLIAQLAWCDYTHEMAYTFCQHGGDTLYKLEDGTCVVFPVEDERRGGTLNFMQLNQWKHIPTKWVRFDALENVSEIRPGVEGDCNKIVQCLFVKHPRVARIYEQLLYGSVTR